MLCPTMHPTTRPAIPFYTITSTNLSQSLPSEFFSLCGKDRGWGVGQILPSGRLCLYPDKKARVSTTYGGADSAGSGDFEFSPRDSHLPSAS